MKLIKYYFQAMDRLFPAVAAKKVYHFLSNPRIRKLRDFEEAVLQKSVKERIVFRSFQIQTYTWGKDTDKTVFLVHGWEGQAGNFGALVDILLEKGYCVVAFDGPSHGKSSTGATTMFEFSELVTMLVKKYKPQYVISHSFGSVTSMVALSENPDVPIEQWLVVTTPHNFKDRVNDIKTFLGVTDRTITKVIEMIESETKQSIDNLNMDYYGTKVPHVKKVTIVHSKDDKVLPIESARIAHQNIPQSTLMELEGLGHYSILWSAQLKALVADFF